MLGMGAAMPAPQKWKPARDVGGTCSCYLFSMGVRSPLLFHLSAYLTPSTGSLSAFLGLDNTGVPELLCTLTHLFTHLCTDLASIYQPDIHLSTRPPTHQAAHPLVQSHTHLSTCPPTPPTHHPLTRLPTHALIRSPICPPIQQSAH